MSLFRPNIKAMTGYSPGEQLTGEVLKLNANENPYPPSPRVLAALRDAIDGNFHRYPDPVATCLREEAGKLYGVSPNMVLCGNGSDDLLTIIVRSFVGEGEKIVSPQPSYILYRTLADIQGAEFEAVEFPPDYSLPPGLADADGKVTFVANPNSPSGTMIPVHDLEELAESLNGILVVDEAYVDFADENAMRLARKFDNVVVLRTLSKSYSLAGMRVGLAVAHESLIEGMLKVKDSYNINVLSIIAGTAALSDQEYLQEIVGKIRKTRQYIADELRDMDIEVFPSQSNFVMARFGEDRVRKVYEALKAQRILIRYYDVPGVRDCLRITVGTQEQTERVVGELRTFLNSANAS